MAWLASLFLTALPAFAQAPAFTLSSDSEARWVSFELSPQNQIRFTLELDDQPVIAMLDTAVSSSAISRRQAERMKLKVSGEGSAAAIGGDIGIGWATVHSVALGGLRRTGGALAVADFAEAATGADVAMLLGADLLAGHALDIDYAARRFRVLRSGRMPYTGSSAPLRIGTDLGFYIGEMTLDGRRVSPMVIDTGDGAAVTIARDVWTPPAEARVTSTVSHGLAGSAVSDLTMLPELRIGALTARDVPLTIEHGDGYSRRIGIAGRIGSGFLRHYRVLLDPAAGHMILAPGADVAAETRSTSGLLVERRGEALIVLHVMRGGPAAAAGWRVGERICAVDGAVPPAVDWLAGAAGRTVSLTLCGGETRRLTLAAFY